MEDSALVSKLEETADRGASSTVVADALDLIQQWQLGQWKESHRRRAQSIVGPQELPEFPPTSSSDRPRAGSSARRHALAILNIVAKQQSGLARHSTKALISEVLGRSTLPQFLEARVVGVLASNSRCVARLQPACREWAQGKMGIEWAGSGAATRQPSDLVHVLALRLGMGVVDHRMKDGALWLLGDLPLESGAEQELRAAGFNLKSGKGWWIK